MITLQEQLEIILPTYNRREHLQRTLTQLTAPESPVRHCSLTVLDNACQCLYGRLLGLD